MTGGCFFITFELVTIFISGKEKVTYNKLTNY